MSERSCICGNRLSTINRSLKCYECRENEKRDKRRATGQKRLDDAKAAGQVRLHSCLSSIHDAAPVSCMCRKFISFTQARQFINLGRAVDFLTRETCFHERAVVEVSRLKNPPISTLGSRIAIERKIDHPVVDEKDIARLKATADEDKCWRAKEQDCKIDIEHQIAVEEQAKLIRVYTDAEWLAIEREFALHRGFCDGIGIDERTLGSVGLNVRPQRATLTDEEEIEERAEKPATDDAEPEAEIGTTSIDDIQPESELNDAAEDWGEFDHKMEKAA